MTSLCSGDCRRQACGFDVLIQTFESCVLAILLQTNVCVVFIRTVLEYSLLQKPELLFVSNFGLIRTGLPDSLILRTHTGIEGSLDKVLKVWITVNKRLCLSVHVKVI